MSELRTYSMTINGVSVQSPTTIPVLNPATEQIVGYAPDCTKEQLDEAVQTAKAAFPAWAATPIEKRKEVMLALAKVISDNAQELSALLTAEQGKPLDKAQGDVLGGAFWLNKMTTIDLPVEVGDDGPDRYAFTRYVPVGVVGAIVPWNFPMVIGIVKVSQALVAGNTVVVKPSPFTPLSMLRFGELISQVVPPGVVNIISGGDNLGPLMTSHPLFDKISFTGSTFVGKKVMQNCAETMKRVTLELGGNDSAIVLPDVNVQQAAKDIFWGAFFNTGQVCIATKRLYVHESVYDELKTALVDYAKTVKVGNGAEQGVELGPINNKPQYQRVVNLLNDCKDQGYSIAVGGELPKGPGYFIPPTIIDNPPEQSRIVQEEQFGPVLPMLKYSNLDDVIEKVNNTPYGLGNIIWTSNPRAAVDITPRLQSGTVWINEFLHLDPMITFGGHKQSGLGAEGGLAGVLAFTNPQTIYMKKPAQAANL